MGCGWCLDLLILEPVKIIISTVFTVLVIFPSVTIVFGINEVVRLLVRCLLYYNYRGRIQLVKNGRDGLFCHSQKVYLRTLVTYDLPFSPEKFERLVNDCIFKDSCYNEYQWKLRQIVTLKYGYYCWKEDAQFQLSNHIRQITNEQQVVTEKQLLPLIDNLSNRLGEVQPQWEIGYIPNIENRKFGVVFNSHHAYGDGMSLAIMMAQKLSPVKPFPYIMNPLAFSMPWITQIFFNLKAYLYLGWAVVKGFYKRPKTSQLPKRSRDDDDIPEVCHLAKLELSSPAVKSIRDYANVPMPAVLLCAYARSMEAVMRKKGDKIPSALECGFTIPKFPYEEALSNRMVNITTKVALPRGGKQLDRRHLIRCLEEISAQLSKSFNDSFIHSDFSLHGRLPASMIDLPSSYFISSGSFVNSNYAFSRKKVSMGSAIPTSIYVWPTLLRSDTYNLHISNVSYGDTISASLIAKSTKMSKEDMNLLVEEISNQLKYLESRICVNDDVFEVV